MTKSLNAVEVLALARLLPEKLVKESRLQIDEEGEHFNLDFTVHITGQLEIEEVEWTDQINKLQPWQLLKHAMNKMNDVTLQKFIKEALATPAFDVDNNKEDKKFKARTAKAWKSMAASTNQKRMGKIIPTNLELTKV